jgi:adenylate cyclase
MKNKEKKARVLLSIGAKLVLIISIMFLVSLGAVILMVSVLSTQEVQKTAEDNNFTVNQRAASQAEESFKSIQETVLFYLEMLELFPASSGYASYSVGHNLETDSYFFSHNRNIAAIGVSGPNAGSLATFIPNVQFLDLNGINARDVEEYLASGFSADADQIKLLNASPVFQISLIAAVFVRQGRSGEETVKVLFAPGDLFDSFSTGTNTSFIANGSGDLLLHPDIYLVLGGANISSLPIVEAMLQQGDRLRQISYADGEAEYFGAYCRLAGMDAAVFTTIPHNIVFEAARGITRQNMYLALSVLFITIIFIWFFAKTIARPARALAAAALQIEEGKFDFYLKPRTHDELGLLTESFNNMSRALKIFGRFTNKDIALRAIRGEIKPGGVPMRVTVFFSDIRGFTEKSEGFARAFGDDASNRIVLWLNEYLTQMVQCVEKTGGAVDKFIGDAIMAHWGTVVSAGSPNEDAYNSVKTALMMRETLLTVNNERPKKDPGNPVIRIGCGINTGMVTTGQIGSNERMEYTIIGNPVNLASRLEALNKFFGTDILITEDTWKLVGDKFITEEMLPTKVKGYENPVRVFAVVNYKKPESGPQTLKQLRELLGIDAPDASKLDMDADDREEMYETRSHRYAHGHKQSSRQDRDRTGIGAAADPAITMTSFGSSARVHGPAESLVPVFFSWNKHNFRSDTYVIVEVALDQDFDNILEERDVIATVSVSIPLADGQYWWRVYTANPGSREPANTAYPSGVLMVDTNAKEKVKIQKA